MNMVQSGVPWTNIPVKPGLKTLFNIVEERFKKLLNFDVSAV